MQPDSKALDQNNTGVIGRLGVMTIPLIGLVVGWMLIGAQAVNDWEIIQYHKREREISFLGNYTIPKLIKEYSKNPSIENVEKITALLKTHPRVTDRDYRVPDGKPTYAGSEYTIDDAIKDLSDVVLNFEGSNKFNKAEFIESLVVEVMRPQDYEYRRALKESGLPDDPRSYAVEVSLNENCIREYLQLWVKGRDIESQYQRAELAKRVNPILEKLMTELGSKKLQLASTGTDNHLSYIPHECEIIKND